MKRAARVLHATGSSYSPAMDALVREVQQGMGHVTSRAREKLDSRGVTAEECFFLLAKLSFYKPYRDIAEVFLHRAL